jgi:hypothetical protein
VADLVEELPAHFAAALDPLDEVAPRVVRDVVGGVEELDQRSGPSSSPQHLAHDLRDGCPVGDKLSP